MTVTTISDQVSSEEGVKRSYPGKRALDLTIALVALLLLWPIILVVAVLVASRLGRPIIFRQQRPGLNGKPFFMCKFRSMREADGPDGRPLPDEERLTPFGRLLRATSLDELPTLINVIKGEMSLVGPRPLMMGNEKYYTPEQARRLDVLPGVTGWAQVNGRNAVTYEETFRHDVWYVDHQSLTLDLRILGLTAIKILRREGTIARKEMWEE